VAHFLVTFAAGPDWDPECSRREQSGWEAHAEFMDALAVRGSVILAGPVGEDEDTGDALAVVSAEGRVQATALFEADPWHDSILTVESVLRWNLWLGSLERAL
jgi:uncharacterized protein YciI